MPTLTTGMTRVTKARGFTLLELMVVLVILVLLSGAVAISIGASLQEARLRAGARTVIAMLRYARSYAVTHHTETMVEFDSVRHGLAVQVYDADEDDTEQWRPLTTSSGIFRQLPDGIAIVDVQMAGSQNGTDQSGTSDVTDMDNPTVTFSALGQASDAMITLRNKKNKQLLISLDALTGRCDLTESIDEK